MSPVLVAFEEDGLRKEVVAHVGFASGAVRLPPGCCRDGEELRRLVADKVFRLAPWRNLPAVPRAEQG